MSAFFMFLCASCTNSAYGSEVLIYIAEDLLKIESNDNRRFKLMNDLDCEGKTFTGIQDFQGIFDGNGYKISNINITSTNNCYGFFQVRTGLLKLKI